MSNLLIIYHSHTGNTEAMAKAIAESAVAAGAKVTLKKVADTAPEDMLKYDAVVFGTPNEFGRMCGILQDFFERAWLGVANSPGSVKYTVFSSGGSTATGAVDSVESAMNGFNRMKQLKFTKYKDGLVGSSREQANALSACRDFGKKIATV